MASKKATPVRRGITPEEFQTALKEFAHAQNRVDKIDAERDAKILAAKAHKKDDYDCCVQKAEETFALIQQYCLEHQELFTEAKSITTAFATYGYRINPPAVNILNGYKEKDVIQLMLDDKYTDYLVPKYSLDKVAIKKQEENKAVMDRLWEYHVEVSQTEQFFVEPIQDKA